MIIYTVQPGDTVDAIAASYGVSADSIIYINQLIPPYALGIGQSLLLNNGPADSQRFGLVSFGYAYPYISPWVLEQTLPFLTDLYVFSYGFTEQGNLVPPTLDDTWMLEAATLNGVRPILTLTPLGRDGKFNNSLITSVVQNPDNRETLINELLDVMTKSLLN